MDKKIITDAREFQSFKAEMNELDDAALDQVAGGIAGVDDLCSWFGKQIHKFWKNINN